MSHLKSLEICGVRLFSPDSKETVNFTTPVTLFLGQNGCGKTTLIECIRFALTGEVPAGTSSGQGFLNDPSMAGVNGTKGSVKLKYVDVQGNTITISRFMQVTKKPGGKLQFKNTEVNIRRRERNSDESNDISGRCADADAFCCTSLNASKAVLNHVLFCHQENSFWPLDEPQKLKQKFDEIFDAIKYNKYVDATRKAIKDQMQPKVKVLQERLLLKERIKQEVERARAKFEDRKSNFEKITESIKEKKEYMRPLEKRMGEICDLEGTLGALQQTLSGKQVEKKGLREQQETLLRQISFVFEGTDAELRERIESFEQQQKDEEKSIGELERKKNDLIAEGATLNSSMQKVQMKIGELKEEQNQYTKKQTEVRSLVERLRSKMNLTTSTELDNRDLVTAELEDGVEKEEKQYRKLVKEKEEEEKEMQSRIDTEREKFVSVRQTIESKKGLLKEYGNKARNIREQLEELGSSDSQLKVVGDKIERLQTTLTTLKSSFNEKEKNKEIYELKETIDTKEQFLDKLDREYRLLQQNYITEQKLENENHIVSEKQAEINKINLKHRSDLEILFGENVPASNYRRAVLLIQKEQDANCKKLTDRVGRLEKEVSALEMKLRMLKDELKKHKENLEKDKKKVEQACKDKPFGQILNETYAKKELLQKEKGQYSSAKIMYEAFIQKFESDSCCPICKTNFGGKDDDLKGIVNQLKCKITAIPQKLVESERNLKNAEETYNTLQQLKPVHDEIEVLTRTKIPQLQEKINALEDEFQEKQMELASEKANLDAPQRKVEICKNIISDVTLLDQYTADVKKAKINIEQLKEEMVTVASQRTRQEAEAEIDVGKAELSNLRNRYESNKKMLDQHRERCQTLNDQIQNETKKQLNIQKLLQERPMLETQLKEFDEKVVTLNSEIERLDEQLREHNQRLNNVTEERQAAVKRNNKLKDEESRRINANKILMMEVKKLYTAIETYIKNDTQRELELTVEKLAKLKIKEKEIEEARNKLIDTISTKKQNLAKKESDKRALDDNVVLRERQAMEKIVDVEIKELQKNIAGYNYRSLHEEKLKIDRKLEIANREINTLEGQINEIRTQMKELHNELEQPEKKNAYKNYKKQMYELKVLEQTIADISVYVNVLEKSILKFHEERMTQINAIIRHLWRNIYKGNDIDYVEIKTNVDMKGGVNKRRTYNYKVVQVKNEVELEMRGRCSAGQKVLASLVIRIALAETFSNQCGILALDEPTTNLDKENILSLSAALSKIIQDRERDSNFQLLVITHDEDFLSALTKSLSVDSCWDVKRNQLGFSTVQRRLL